MRPDLAVHEGDPLDQLRERVLALGEELGWTRPEAKVFAEGLTGRRWEDCAVADLVTVEGEYLAIQQTIEAKRRGRCARTTGFLAGYRPGDPT